MVGEEMRFRGLNKPIRRAFQIESDRYIIRDKCERRLLEIALPIACRCRSTFAIAISDGWPTSTPYFASYPASSTNDNGRQAWPVERFVITITSSIMRFRLSHVGERANATALPRRSSSVAKSQRRRRQRRRQRGDYARSPDNLLSFIRIRDEELRRLVRYGR